MPNHHPYPHTDLQEVSSRNQTAAQIMTALARAPLPVQLMWAQVIAALADIDALIDEVTGLRAELTSIRHQRANALAAMRATLAADRDGDDDPLYYVRDELDAQANRSDRLMRPETTHEAATDHTGGQ
ncbi:hypothetical protein ACFOY2_12055 [Nonomuraea purpurea]|uniref:Uncharacterized protein n=1 Tax=Nonomuraea purpurea TaxID=1849276 RepID=A0ABV8G469_9ACTN